MTNECKQCGHKWQSRRVNHAFSRCCPKCKSYRWQTPKPSSGTAAESREQIAHRGTIESEGLQFISLQKGTLTVFDPETGRSEEWQRNDGHASFGIVYKGHDYEFCRFYIT